MDQGEQHQSRALVESFERMQETVVSLALGVSLRDLDDFSRTAGIHRRDSRDDPRLYDIAPHITPIVAERLIAIATDVVLAVEHRLDFDLDHFGRENVTEVELVDRFGPLPTRVLDDLPRTFPNVRDPEIREYWLVSDLLTALRFSSRGLSPTDPDHVWLIEAINAAYETMSQSTEDADRHELELLYRAVRAAGGLAPSPDDIGMT